VEVQENFAFAVTEFFDAKDLTSIDSVSDPRNILRDITQALRYLHEAKVLHRDVKPENVLFGGGMAKLCDFGVARGIVDATLTVSHQFLGTIRYAPPEYLFDQSYYEDSDFFGLGHIAYWLCAGKMLISADLPFAKQVLGVNTLSFKRIPSREKIPNGHLLEALIANLLAVDPSSRFGALQVKDILDLPNMDKTEQKVIINGFETFKDPSGFESPKRWWREIPKAMDLITNAKDVFQSVADEVGYQSQYKKTGTIDNRAIRIVATFLASWEEDQWKILKQAGLIHDPEQIEGNPELGVLTDSDRLVIIALSKVSTEAMISVLPNCFSVDSEAASLVREAFMENGDFGDAEAYSKIYKLNERMRALFA